MTKIRHKVCIAVYAVFIKEGKVLLQRRENSGFCDGMYGIPSGHVEENEMPTESLVREIKEEIDVDFTKENIKFSSFNYHMVKDGNDYVNLFFVIEKWEGEPKIMEPDKCSDLGWFSIDDMPENTIEYVKNGILNSLENKNYSEHIFEEK
ncbi:NUDIX domain-containing protein [Candidatus Nomurabacteria bacterium]|nr:NUDIX domain-containing protein [Candidatus Nomurabacteria bacterium]